MSSPFELLQAGIDAVKQGRYSEAVRSLEAFCHSSTVTNSQNYVQAQMWLVKAYQKNGQSKQAIALCHQLATSENPQVQIRARQILQSLSTPNVSQPQSTESSPQTQPTQANFEEQDRSEQPTAQFASNQQSLTQEQAATLLKVGNKALKQALYAKAVQALEEFCRGVDATAQDYPQAQMWLVKAYKGNGQLEEAIALCQQLTTSEHEIVQIWAQQFLPSLSPSEIPDVPSLQPEPISQQLKPTSQGTQIAQVSQSRTRPSTTGPDFTRPILSAVCHGSIIFASGFLPILIPLAIWILSKDNVVRENAKEALSFFITMGVWAIVCGILWLLFKIAIVLLILLVVFSWVMPIMAIMQCIQTPDQPVRYPLISHLF